MQQGRLYTVRAAHCILACWHPVIPYLTNELPAPQVAALRSAEKVPLVYTNVALRNWESFVRLQTRSVTAPGCYFTAFDLDRRVSIGEYHCTKRPEEPIVLTMERYPCSPGLPARSQHRAGRADLYATSFETFERKIRELLARSLGAGGFDPARDIEAITVNRWPHGYAYQYNSLWDPFWLKAARCLASRHESPLGGSPLPMPMPTHTHTQTVRLTRPTAQYTISRLRPVEGNRRSLHYASLRSR